MQGVKQLKGHISTSNLIAETFRKFQPVKSITLIFTQNISRVALIETKNIEKIYWKFTPSN